METLSHYLAPAIVTGVGATAIMDGWTVARKRLLGIPALDYGLVGRWLAYLARGRFRHENIATTPRVAGEGVIGWTAHYVTGIAFAALLLAVFGLEWARHPTIAPALIVGIGTVAAPFLVLQPGMGAGIAASRTACPPIARLRSVMTHAVFGFGLFVAGWLYSQFT